MLNRLKEPSTWAALGAFLAALGIATDLEAETWRQVGAGVAAAVAIVGTVLRETGGRDAR